MPRRPNTSNFLDWDRYRIGYELKRRGITWVEVGAMVEPPIKGTGARNALFQHWTKAEEAIAKALGVPASIIWPSRYPQKRDAA